MESGRDDRAAVDKAFSLLMAFGDDGSVGLGVSELARRADLSKSTAFRVLAMLERNAVIDRVGTNYRISPNLPPLGGYGRQEEHDRLHDLLLPFVSDLYQLTRQTVHLAALDGTDVIYLAKLYGHRAIPTPSRIGHRLPAHCTAVGKILLAYDSDAAASALAAPLKRLTSRSIIDPAVLSTQLFDARRNGIAQEHGESQAAIKCTAAPVTDRSGKVVAALSVSTSMHDASRPPANILRQVCASASQALARSGLARSA